MSREAPKPQPVAGGPVEPHKPLTIPQVEFLPPAAHVDGEYIEDVNRWLKERTEHEDERTR